MSKSKKNVVDPTVIVDAYGADTARLFMLSDSPPERDLEWSDSGVEGAYKYINRLWKMVAAFRQQAGDKDLPALQNAEGDLLKIKKQIHKTIDAVTEDLDNFRLNKAVARIRELTNGLSSMKTDSDAALSLLKEGLETAILLFQPMIPHITEELWQIMGHKKMAIDTKWPVASDEYLVDDLVTIALQINGKLKATIEFSKDAPKENVEKAALENPKMAEALSGKEIRKIIIVPNRIVNVVA